MNFRLGKDSIFKNVSNIKATYILKSPVEQKLFKNTSISSAY